MKNYFNLFNLDCDYFINIKELEKIYQEKIMANHPDKFVNQDSEIRQKALQNTSILNSAYEILKSPEKRANYILKLNGINAFKESDTKMDAEFLLKQIELREELEYIDNIDELYNFLEKINQEIKDSIVQISQGFENNDLLKVRNLIRELKFFKQLQQQTNTLMDKYEEQI